MCVAEEVSEALLIAQAHVDGLTAERASLNAGIEQEKGRAWQLGWSFVLTRSYYNDTKGTFDLRGGGWRSLNCHVAAGENKARIVEARAEKELVKSCTLQALVKGLNWTVGGEGVLFAGLVGA